MPTYYSLLQIGALIAALLNQTMPEIEAEFKEFTFIQVDRDENLDLCQELMVMGIPSFIVYRDGKEVARFVNKDRKTKAEVTAFLSLC